jgi:hypothetical protein
MPLQIQGQLMLQEGDQAWREMSTSDVHALLSVDTAPENEYSSYCKCSSAVVGVARCTKYDEDPSIRSTPVLVQSL